jgi:hypothetical protein
MIMADVESIPAPAPTAATDSPAVAAPLTPYERKMAAVKLYYDTNDRQERKALVKKYPILKEVFSAANHDS